MTKQILIGIPTYCGCDIDILPACLQSIKDRSGDTISYNLVVLDDSGKQQHQEKSRLVAEKFGAHWIYNEKNSGITASWNKLVQSTDDPLIVLFNDDIIVNHGWLEALVYFLDNNPSCGSVGLEINQLKKHEISTTLAMSSQPTIKKDLNVTSSTYGIPNKIMCPAGCSFGFTREKYNLVGGFDPNMRQFYNESDFGTALAAKGYASFMLPWPIVWHVWSATFSAAPELLRTNPVQHDRLAYMKKWGGDFPYTDPLYMKPIKPQLMHWLTPDGHCGGMV